MEKMITSNGEVLHYSLMVSTQKHKNKNSNVLRKRKYCHSQCVLWLCLCLLLSVWVRRSWYRLSLVQDPKTRMPAGLGGAQKEKAGLESFRLISLRRDESQSLNCIPISGQGVCEA